METIYIDPTPENLAILFGSVKTYNSLQDAFLGVTVESLENRIQGFRGSYNLLPQPRKFPKTLKGRVTKFKRHSFKTRNSHILHNFAPVPVK